jgi:hypothetical protein
MLYRQLGSEPADDDPIVGLVDTPELAALIVAAVNARHASPSVPVPGSQDDQDAPEAFGAGTGESQSASGRLRDAGERP